MRCKWTCTHTRTNLRTHGPLLWRGLARAGVPGARGQGENGVPQVHAHSATSTRADGDAIFVVERQIIGPSPAALGHGGVDALFVTLPVHAHEHVPHRLHLAVQHRHLRQATSRSARDDTHARKAQEGRTLRNVRTICTPPHGPAPAGSGTGRRRRPGVSPRPASATAVCCRGRPFFSEEEELAKVTDECARCTDAQRSLNRTPAGPRFPPGGLCSAARTPLHSTLRSCAAATSFCNSC